MPKKRAIKKFSLDQVRRFWLWRQGLSRPRSLSLDKTYFEKLLLNTGGLQLDSVNVLCRAHYLTLWSRFGTYDCSEVDTWIYKDRVAFEYWGHEASVLPMERLPLAKRGMKLFSPRGGWWAARTPSETSIERVLKRIGKEGPLESSAFEPVSGERGGPWWGWKEDKQSLEVLWLKGRLAISNRKSFRKLYDLASRVYPKCPMASVSEYEDGWLITGLKANGIAPERHLHRYFTAPDLKAIDRKRIIQKNLKNGIIAEVEVEGLPGPNYILPKHLETVDESPEPDGTTLLCPFDSLLWQRKRAEELFDFRYRVEIYTPPAKRVFGYYVMPILHNGGLVGRVDPKFRRDKGILEVNSIHLEKNTKKDKILVSGISEAIEDLANFLGANDIHYSRNW